MTRIRVKQTGEKRMAADLRRLPERLDDVSHRVVAAVTQWAGDELADSVAAASQVPRAVLLRRTDRGPRVIVRIHKQGARRGAIWFGAEPVPAEYLGEAVQTAEGVRVGPHNLAGAFLAQFITGHAGVFYRIPPSVRHSSGRPWHWQPNLPLTTAGVDLYAEEAVLSIDARIPGQLASEAARTVETFFALPRGPRRE